MAVFRTNLVNLKQKTTYDDIGNKKILFTCPKEEAAKILKPIFFSCVLKNQLMTALKRNLLILLQKIKL